MAAIVKGKHDLPALLASVSMPSLLPSYERIQAVLTLSFIIASARRFDCVSHLCAPIIRKVTSRHEAALCPETESSETHHARHAGCASLETNLSDPLPLWLIL